MNIIDGIINIINNHNRSLKELSNQNNRVSAQGLGFEEYIKDVLSNSLFIDESTKAINYANTFSYLGGKNNPPDIMLIDGDAIEIKKVQSKSKHLSLNSSYPRQYLYYDDKLITNECKNAEVWERKEVLYIIGVVDDNIIKSIYMFYGCDYCANKEVYENMLLQVRTSIENNVDAKFSPTKEIARINNIEKDNISYLRVRGMWGLKSPWEKYKDLDIYSDKEFNLFFIVNEDKYNSFENKEKLENLDCNNLSIRDVYINEPNGEQQRKAKLIRYYE